MRGKGITQEQEAEMLRMYASGKTMAEIADHIGRNYHTVRARLKRSDIYIPFRDTVKGEKYNGDPCKCGNTLRHDISKKCVTCAAISCAESKKRKQEREALRKQPSKTAKAILYGKVV